MGNHQLKDKIHQLVENSDEEMLEAVYQLLQQTDYTEEFKNILNEEFSDYQRNKQAISKAEMDALIQEVLNKH